MTLLRIATRSSAQARTQAEVVGDSLVAAHSGLKYQLVFVETLGDVRGDVPLHQMGGQGIFVKEVQNAVLSGAADIAVHSAKDLPGEQAPGLFIGAFCRRRTPNDALVGSTLDGLAHGATVATGSVRRRSQLQALRPDLNFIELRGNIQTRLSKIPDGGAIVMAVAALEILGLTESIAQVMDVELMVPMVGQGSVAVECRADDDVTKELLAAIDHQPTRRSVEAERAFLLRLGAGCSLPVAAHLGNDDVFHAYMSDRNQSVQIAGEIGHSDDHRVVGAALADECRRRLGERPTNI